VTSETALFAYKCTDFYDPSSEFTLRWNDLAIGIEWPESAPELSTKDAAGLNLADFPADALPEYR